MAKAAPKPPSTASRDLADADYESVVSMTRDLIRIPTRAGFDSYEPIIDYVTSRLTEHKLTFRVLQDTQHDDVVGIVCDIQGQHPGPRYVLDACLDTAPFGDVSAWRYPPASGAVAEGWLHGRGAADSKAAISIFTHIAAHIQAAADDLKGSLTLLFDADEHTGRFGGAKGYFDAAGAANEVAGVMIGYPGADQLIVGGRGFFRADVTVYGRAGHTGSQRAATNPNAITKAAALVQRLATQQTPGGTDSRLGLAPQISVTKIVGGESYSIIPDECRVSVDMRLTTTFDQVHAAALLSDLVNQLDAEHEAPKPSHIATHESWPAYVLPENSRIRQALTRSAHQHMPGNVATKVGGPSNIGNYLAKLGIDATAGLGVHYEGLHGTNERIELASIPAVEATYHAAVLDLLT